jgi:hypothetical protein
MQIYCYYSEETSASEREQMRKTEKTLFIWARDLSVNYCELLTITVVDFGFRFLALFWPVNESIDDSVVIQGSGKARSSVGRV